MTDIRVWAGAGGGSTQTGAEWENAVLELPRTLVEGNRYFVSKDHQETASGSPSFSGPNAKNLTTEPPQVLCVQGAPTGTGGLAPARMRDEGTGFVSVSTSPTLVGAAYWRGMNMLAGVHHNIGGTSGNQRLTLEDMDFEADSVGVNYGVRLGNNSTHQVHRLRGCRIFVLADKLPMVWRGFLHMTMENCAVVWAATPTVTHWVGFQSFYYNQIVRIRNMDLSNGPAAFFDAATANVRRSLSEYSFERCKLPAGHQWIGNGTLDWPNFRIRTRFCAIGTKAAPEYEREELAGSRGHVYMSTSRTRQGSKSTDGTTPTSMAMDVTNAKGNDYPHPTLRSLPLTRFVDGDGVKQYRVIVYLASKGTQNNDNVWGELFHPNEANTSARWEMKSTRRGLLDAPAPLLSDGSTWNGSDVSVVQKLEWLITPDKPGQLTAYVYVAETGGVDVFVVFVDGYLYVEEV